MLRTPRCGFVRSRALLGAATRFPSVRAVASAGAQPVYVDPVPGSVGLPPRPPVWRMALRAGTILGELGAMQWRRVSGVPTDVRAVKMREAFIRLGPAFVKAGQALATRPDTGFPPEVCAWQQPYVQITC